MKDKVVVITGASRGLGKSLAQVFASKGAKVVVSGRDRNDLLLVSKEISALPIVCDVTKEDQVSDLAQKATQQFGRIDIWINNAGIWLPRAPVEEIDMKRAHDLLEVNLFGTVYGSRVALVQMKNQGFGTIINIVSTAALQGRPLSTLYSASKYAARGFTDSLREEVRDSGVKVVGIYPGGIKTDLFNEKKPEDFDDFMSPESVAQKIVDNLEKLEPETEMVLRRPGQSK